MAKLQDKIKPFFSPVVGALVTYSWYLTSPLSELWVLAGVFIFTTLVALALLKEWKLPKSASTVLKYFIALILAIFMAYSFYNLNYEYWIVAVIFIVTLGIGSFMLKKLSFGGGD